jgi:DnaJ-class molecular chaperone
MQQGITWYDVLGVLPGAAADRIRREYQAKAALLRPEMISGARPDVLEAVTRAQELLDGAWEVLGDPASRGRYDEAIGLRRSGGGLGQPGSVGVGGTGSGLGPSDMGSVAQQLGGDTVGGLLTLAGWLGPKRRRQPPTTVPDVRGLFYPVCLEVAGRYGLRVTLVRLTERPMAVDGLVVDQSPWPAARARRGDAVTVQVWHPPAR